MLVPIQMGNDDDLDDLPGTMNNNNNNINNPGGNGIGPGIGIGGMNGISNERDAWMENQRRQRSIRTLMMILMMLVLMDGEEGNNANRNVNSNNNNNRNKKRGNIRGRNKDGTTKKENDVGLYMNEKLWHVRRDLDEYIHDTYHHTFSAVDVKEGNGKEGFGMGKFEFERWHRLLHLNNDIDEEQKILDRITAATTTTSSSKGGGSNSQSITTEGGSGGTMTNANVNANDNDNAESVTEEDADDKKLVYHYPRNVTGLYRGDWIRITDPTNSTIITRRASTSASTMSTTTTSTHTVEQSKNNNNEKKKDLLSSSLSNTTMISRKEVLNLIPDEHSQHTKESSFIGLQHLPPDTIYENDDAIWKIYDDEGRIDNKDNEDGKDNKNEDRAIHSSSASTDDILTTDSHNMKYSARDFELMTSKSSTENKKNGGYNSNYDEDEMKLDITKDSGTVIVQLFTRTIEGMTQMSLVDGVIKLTNVNDRSIISHLKHVTLRVRGIVIHSLGRVSLVANDHLKTVFVVKDGEEEDNDEVVSTSTSTRTRTTTDEGKKDEDASDAKVVVGRKLLEVMNDKDKAFVGEEHVEALRNDALEAYGHLFDDHQVGGEGWNEHFTTPGADVDLENMNRRLLEELDNTSPSNENVSERENNKSKESDNESTSDTSGAADEGEPAAVEGDKGAESNSASTLDLPRPYVGSAPWVPDDEEGSLIRIPANIIRATPDILLHNGRSCEFEIDFNIEETQWTLGDWYREEKELLANLKDSDPTNKSNSDDDAFNDRHRGNMNDGTSTDRDALKKYLDETYVMNMVGTINSPQCNFMSNVNVTAIRTDWERTTSKAINYCFIMMMVCLTQTVYFLRQLVHSTPQSSALRVSLIMVGWQTLLDAMFCLSHILLCVILKPVTTAFGKFH